MAENKPDEGKPPEGGEGRPQEEKLTPLEKARWNAVKALDVYLSKYFNATSKTLKKNLDGTLESDFAAKLIGRYESKIRSRIGQINPGVKVVEGGEPTIAPTVATITFDEIDATV